MRKQEFGIRNRDVETPSISKLYGGKKLLGQGFPDHFSLFFLLFETVHGFFTRGFNTGRASRRAINKEAACKSDYYQESP
jgi:hypothetical protein